MALFFPSDMSSWTDSRLVREVVSDNSDAILYLFYEKYSATFQYHIYRIFPGRIDVEELVDEFFLYLRQDGWRRLRTYDGSKSSLNTWISTVSFRFFKNYRLSKIDCGGLITTYDKWETYCGSWVRGCDESLEIDLGKALSSIQSERDRNIARRIFLDDAEPGKVAAEFGLDVDYVYTIKNRLLKHIRKVLNDYGNN